MGGVDAQAEFFEPLQKALDLSRSAKVLSKKLIKRVEDLTQDSMALKAHFVPQLQALTNTVPELVNFGFSLAQQVMPYLSEARSSKTPFKFATVLDFVRQCAASTVWERVRVTWMAGSARPSSGSMTHDWPSMGGK